MTETEGRHLAADLAHVPIETVGTRGLLEDALAVALATGITVYDAMYLTVAVRLDTAVVTGDDRLQPMKPPRKGRPRTSAPRREGEQQPCLHQVGRLRPDDGIVVVPQARSSP